MLNVVFNSLEKASAANLFSEENRVDKSVETSSQIKDEIFEMMKEATGTGATVSVIPSLLNLQHKQKFFERNDAKVRDYCVDMVFFVFLHMFLGGRAPLTR